MDETPTTQKKATPKGQSESWRGLTKGSQIVIKGKLYRITRIETSDGKAEGNWPSVSIKAEVI